ncbi:chorismate synthase [candidate division WOR-1 bacterium RIFOXYB2_FULL_48_7]|uniref:Chorismate synthase n=1 Tax=candidate division WOR-1 bacterium RIFOXYB2_FULL_48_7 TaxID=1802583 RepID=A0A1F4TDH6_UNCSA|nr:MAG: chorismate synthase [candidate division WOR-1 bacterium RIFOXYB2_FULL_48_7]
MLGFLTAGESHGQALVAILEGCPADLPLTEKEIALDLARRQGGHGRGGRMKIESDHATLLSGVRHGKTIGSPIALLIPNKSTTFFEKAFTQLRPGHADMAGSLKYGLKDARNILERASARETAARVAVGAVARKLLSELGIKISSRIVSIGGAAKQADWQELIDETGLQGDTLGGVFEVEAVNVPAGLGSHVHWDRRLDGNLARGVMAIPAIKGVELGLGFIQAELLGSQVHDEIMYKKGKGFSHKTNHAGGLEGGMTNGEPVIIRAAMKPISTLAKPLNSVDLASKKPVKAFVERSDVCAVEAAAVVGEAVVALEIAQAVLEKFGGDTLKELSGRFTSYKKSLAVL